MYARKAWGLAAPQIGKICRLTVVDVTGGKNPEGKIVLINPELFRGRRKAGRRGLSFNSGFVVRGEPQFVTVKAQTLRASRLNSRRRFVGGELFAMRSIIERHFIYSAPEHAETRPDPAEDQET